MIRSVLKRDAPIEYARRVGRRSTEVSNPRKILIKFKFYSDKLDLFRHSYGSCYTISNFTDQENILEKVHHDYCKKALNITKFASNTAVRGELGRYPIVNTAYSFAIKYWLRMSLGTKNTLLNEAYTICLKN